MYTGQGDAQINFGNAIDFRTATANKANQKSFDITLTNTGETDRELILYPSRYTPSLGAAVSAVVKDGNIPYASGASDVSGAGSPNTIKMFHEFLENPALITEHRLHSTVPTDQFATKIKIRTYDVFGSFKDEFVDLASSQDLYVTVDKVLNVQTPIEKRSNVEVSITLVGESTLKITAYVAAVLDNDQLFAAKREMAARTLAAQ